MNLFKHSQYLLHVKGFEKMMIISGTYMKKNWKFIYTAKKVNRYQHSKKVVSETPGLEDFAIRLVSWLFLTRRWEEKFYWEFKLQKNLQLILLIKMFFGGANWNNVWANTSKIQVAQMSSCKTDFPCSQLDI